MQLQLRNYAPVIEARLVILRAQPHLRVNWVALAVAHDLAKNKSQAARVLAAYEDVTRDIPPHNYEYSEVVLYHASILEQLEKWDELVTLLETKRGVLYDFPAFDELLATGLANLGRTDEAEKTLYRLLERNVENKKTIRRLLALLSGDKTGAAKQASDWEHLQAWQKTMPRSAALRRMALEVASGDEFRAAAQTYIEQALVKNIPSLFSDLKSLYRDGEKQAAIEDIVEQFRHAWDPSQATAIAEPPTSYVWTMYFLAHHYSYTRRPGRALAYIDSICAHTPTAPELHMTRARILKRAGALHAASDAMEDAQLLDGQDRYLNTKAAKYLLRADRVDEASRMLKLFTKPDVADPVMDLVDMQAVGYLVDDAHAHERTGDDALALKRFHQIDKVRTSTYPDPRRHLRRPA